MYDRQDEFKLPNVSSYFQYCINIWLGFYKSFSLKVVKTPTNTTTVKQAND